ncbi:MAG: hypothetical protein KF768_04120 [Phycisphaeraceae bacterium]|nr:hypothetical protein [Phycisphaeraceae bacterium]
MERKPPPVCVFGWAAVGGEVDRLRFLRTVRRGLRRSRFVDSDPVLTVAASAVGPMAMGATTTGAGATHAGRWAKSGMA